MPRLAVTVITLNEAQDLPDCLRSVSFADDVLVVDSGSTDRTVEIARQMGARVIENPWPGYAAQRQFALDRAQGDWCLVLDADERVSPELQSEIAVAITRENTDGYYIPFETRMFDETLRHGGARGERNLRLMRKSKTRWAQSGSQDRAVVDGELGSLTAPIVHTPYESLTEYFDKLNTKTSQRALELHQNGERFSRRRTLGRILGFFSRYLLRLGFLDGWVGFLHASLNALFDFVTQAKLFDIERRAAQISAEPGSFIPRLATPAIPLDLHQVQAELAAQNGAVDGPQDSASEAPTGEAIEARAASIHPEATSSAVEADRRQGVA